MRGLCTWLLVLALPVVFLGCGGDSATQPYGDAGELENPEEALHTLTFLPQAVEASFTFDRQTRTFVVAFPKDQLPKKVTLHLKTEDETKSIPLTAKGANFIASGNAIPDDVKDIEGIHGSMTAEWAGSRIESEISHDHGHRGHTHGPGDTHAHGSDQPKPWTLPLLIGYCVVIIIASLAGGFLPSWIQLTHRRMQFLISAIGGLMLGIAIFHLWPHAVVELSHREQHGPRGGQLLKLPGTAFQLEMVTQPNAARFYLYRDASGSLRREQNWSLARVGADGTADEIGKAVPRLEDDEIERVVILRKPGNALDPGSQFRVTHSRGDTNVEIPPPISNSLNLSVGWLAAGLLGMFFLLRAFHFHHHGEVNTPDGAASDEPSQTGHTHDHDHDHDCGHHHHHHQELPAGRLSWLGVFLGLALHTLIDGMALAASVSAEAAHYKGFALAGLGTFLAIVLHKPLDAVSITSLMAAGGWSKRARTFANVAFSVTCPIGALIFVAGVSEFSESQHLIVGCALAAAAGVFLCISLADLLPELEFHSHDRIWLSLLLLLGIALAIGIGFLEPEHAHHAH